MLTRREMLAALGAVGAAPTARAEAALEMGDLYVDSTGVTALARRLEGDVVSISGFMAPPLRADALFFVLTRTPSQYCPFCEGEEWTGDFFVAYTQRPVRQAPGWRQVRARGILRIGDFEDPDTGFVSPLRLENATLDHG